MAAESRFLPRPAASRPIRVTPGFPLALLLLLPSLACVTAIGQTAPSANSYEAAIAQTRPNDRILAMQDFLAHGDSSRRKIDALEVLVWDYQQVGNHQRADEWAQKLLEADPENPLGLAVLADSARYNNGTSLDQNMARSLELASRGMKQENAIRPPAGMLATEFVAMQNAVTAWLNGSAGFAYMHQLQYATARGFLRKAAKLEPENPQYVYELALADLMGKQQEPKEGFLYLARAVNLTQGTPAGEQIAAYASGRYQKAGGTAQDWKQYLVATAPPGSAAAGVTAPPSAAVEVAKNAPAGTPKSQLPQSSAPKQEPKGRAEDSVHDGKHLSEAEIAAALTAPPPLPPTQTAPKPISHPGGPVSLGILLEASISNRDNRRSVIYALTDLVRHLRQNDEAFILSFSHDLVFEQDLTANYEYLRDAMESIKPQSGTALLDAVGFASGHLNRISRKNNNRVLLVISDGRDINSTSPPYEVAGAIDSSGVKIYCIGVGINDAANRSRLQALAARSGGRAAFVDPSNFRTAAHEMAAGMGLDFP